MQKLTPKQAAFCREYLVDWNATQAAIRAGYSPRTANEQAARALAKVSIQAEIKRLSDERIRRVDVDADFVVRTLVENVQRSMQVIPVLDAEGNNIGDYRYNGAIANKALELLGRHLGMFTEKQEIAIAPAANIIAHLVALTERPSNVIEQVDIKQAALCERSDDLNP